MKIFDRDGKINFVDEHNVFLGYDNHQCCCENADWFIANTPQTEIQERKEGLSLDLSGWRFDIKFFQQIEDSNHFESGGMVIFRIVNGDAEKFIHIFNSHNGYYGHGFEFKQGNEVLKDGCL